MTRIAAPRGAFLCVEGGEGAGKGGVVAGLAAQLRAAGREVVATREPGGTPEGLELRAMLLGGGGEIWDPWAELLLMTAARVQHLRRVILPALARGSIVVSDRFIGSTLAYQGAGRAMPEAEILHLHRLAAEGLMPDLTILLDVDPRIGVARSLARLRREGLDEARFERLDIGFHDRVRASFLAQAAARPRAHLLVDASLPPEAVTSLACEGVVAWLDTPVV